MLKPAIMYKEEITKKFQEFFYTDDMLYETGANDNWVPDISDCPDERTFEFAVVNTDNNCIGYISFRIDWYASQAYNFGIISFDRGNPLMGKALYEVMDMIINQYKIYRIEWKMVGGNPIEKSYDKFCEKYHGSKFIFHDVIKDKYGKYRNSIVYEVLIDQNKK